MSVLLQLLWPAMAVAAMLGVGLALVFGAGSGLPSARIEVRIGAVLALLLGALATWLGWVPGRPGLWLDIGVLCALAYAAGIAVGTGLRWLLVSRRRPEVGAAGPEPAA